MSQHIVDAISSVTITMRDYDAMRRVVGPDGDEWRSFYYDLRTEQDVLEHWAYNALANNVEKVNRLDGWADMDDDAVTLQTEFAVEFV